MDGADCVAVVVALLLLIYYQYHHSTSIATIITGEFQRTRVAGGLGPNQNFSFCV